MSGSRQTRTNKPNTIIIMAICVSVLIVVSLQLWHIIVELLKNTLGVGHVDSDGYYRRNDRSSGRTHEDTDGTTEGQNDCLFEAVLISKLPPIHNVDGVATTQRYHTAKDSILDTDRLMYMVVCTTQKSRRERLHEFTLIAWLQCQTSGHVS